MVLGTILRPQGTAQLGCPTWRRPLTEPAGYQSRSRRTLARARAAA